MPYGNVWQQQYPLRWSKTQQTNNKNSTQHNCHIVGAYTHLFLHLEVELNQISVKLKLPSPAVHRQNRRSAHRNFLHNLQPSVPTLLVVTLLVPTLLVALQITLHPKTQIWPFLGHF